MCWDQGNVIANMKHCNTLNLQMGVSKGHLCDGWFIGKTFNQNLEFAKLLSIPFPLQKDKSLYYEEIGQSLIIAYLKL